MQPIQSTRPSPEMSRLVVSNLNISVTEAELRTMFQDYGNCRIILRPYQIYANC